MARLPPNIAPRGLTPDQAAAYVGYTAKVFDQLVKQGLMPAALPGGNYDKAAIDAALDRISGLGGRSLADQTAEAQRRAREGHREVRHPAAE